MQFSIQNSYGILFDGAWLWEEYINILLSSHLYHPKNKSKFGAQQLFSDGKGLIYPDSEGQVLIVLNLNKGSTYENNVSARDDVNIIKLGFKIPNKSADYDDFKMQIHESELVLQNFITSQI